MKQKKAAKLLAFLTVIVLAVICLYRLTSVPSVAYRADVAEASAHPELFALAAAENPSVRAQDINSWHFITLTVNVKSRSPFATDWLYITPGQGMIPVSGDLTPVDLPSAETRTLTLTCLSRQAEYTGSAILEYYVLGRYHYMGLK